MHVHEKKWTDKKKSVDGCMSMNKSGRMHPKKKKKKEWTDAPKKKKGGQMHVHEQKWTDAPKKISGRMHVHEQKWTDTKKNVDEVTLSYVGKTMTQSRRTKYI